MASLTPLQFNYFSGVLPIEENEWVSDSIYWDKYLASDTPEDINRAFSLCKKWSEEIFLKNYGGEKKEIIEKMKPRLEKLLNKFLNENTPENVSRAFYLCDIWSKIIFQEDDFELKKEIVSIVGSKVKNVLEYLNDDTLANDRAFSLCEVWSRIIKSENDYGLKAEAIFIVKSKLERLLDKYLAEEKMARKDLNEIFRICEIWTRIIRKENNSWLRRQEICLIGPCLEKSLDKYLKQNKRNRLDVVLRICEIWSEISNREDNFDLRRVVVNITLPRLNELLTRDLSEISDSFERVSCIYEIWKNIASSVTQKDTDLHKSISSIIKSWDMRYFCGVLIFSC